MSEVYSIEPKTCGKVIIYTSLGELEILLFSNECPIACKNFIQLCLNNYYNKNKFFRVIPKFLIQTGDHTNTGLHNEYAFKEPFQNECNSRLKFLYMGCVAFANLNIDNPSNGSQFFITLDKSEWLNNKSTLFGKVAKHSLYNLIKFNNIKTNKNDEPIEDIPYIEYIKVIENPFHHLIPSIRYEEDKLKQKKEESSEIKPKKSLKPNLLSFTFEGSDADQEEEKEEEEKEEEEKEEEEKEEEEKEEEEKEEEENGEEEKGEEENEEEEKGEEEMEDENEEEKQAKINLLKKKATEIEKLNPKKNKSPSSLNEITDLDEEYLKKIKKRKKMSKKEREEESLKKLKEFDNRLKELFSKKGSQNTVSKPDWINTTGLKFRIDSSNAYDYEDLKKNVVDSMDNERKETYNPNFNMKKYKKKREK
ncbi:peptidyl-prolyl cis-trans isomerase, putative [Plasmodium berghei]|uniref:Peptidyl-prolyl cis-trans isomerase, putative n=1 Tax=Plasmodium berghei TaxID=5821 RepID=A0A1D3LQP3_PLABE|nr:peptidyl-prolyl cis-trans isomerase, putative [Plasmodium berghei]SCN26185.1 peptidyl-prolyl cis-trans isomerase, putative [Plasmodium berghei]